VFSAYVCVLPVFLVNKRCIYFYI